MNSRLRKARIKAGYRTATAAIKACGWRNSTYRAHENGQNNFNVEDAELYAKAYGVTAAWLLVGAEGGAEEKIIKAPAKPHKHNCVEQINAIATLLRDDPNNRPLVIKLIDCAQSHLQKIS
jgi:hypothetical protein